MEENGLGIRSLLDFNKTAMIKLAWEFLQNKRTWCGLIRARFYAAGVPIQYYKSSSVWKGIMKGLETLQPDLCWQIGRHSKCMFWRDKWIDGESISEPIPVSLFYSRDFTVGEFIEGGEWRLPAEFMLNFPVRTAQILDMEVPLVKEDRLIWRKSQTGSLSMKLCYEAYRIKMEKDSAKKNIWRPYIPPKISFFVWKICNNCVQTDDNRMVRGAVTVSVCSNCPVPSAMESTQHLLMECEVAAQVLTWAGQTLNENFLRFGSVQELIQWVLERQRRRRLSQVIQCLVFFSFWEIWRSRNQRRIHSKSDSALRIIGRVKNMIHRVTFLLDGVSKNDVKELMIMRKLSIPSKFVVQRDPSEVIWMPPPLHWHKCNFDGASSGQPGNAACGGVFRNGRGFLRGSYATPLGIQTSIFAEIMGLIWAVRIAKIKGWFPLWLESDSTVVVTKVKTKSLDVPWQIRNKWIKCLQVLSENQFHISHIFREGNAVADAMANEGFKLVDFTWWYGLPQSASYAYSL